MSGRILIIDDDHLIRKLLKDFFELLRYEVLCLERARDAQSRIEAESFDIVITDYSMPDMDGIELTRIIRQSKPSLPIIGISAACDERKFLDAGANHFMPKPFELKRLKEVVENYLKAAR
ncbi:MAG: hypothetical protein OHK0032_07020 [Thermodesulfovibrionales bacterium]